MGDDETVSLLPRAKLDKQTAAHGKIFVYPHDYWYNIQSLLGAYRVFLIGNHDDDANKTFYEALLLAMENTREYLFSWSRWRTEDWRLIEFLFKGENISWAKNARLEMQGDILRVSSVDGVKWATMPKPKPGAGEAVLTFDDGKHLEFLTDDVYSPGEPTVFSYKPDRMVIFRAIDVQTFLTYYNGSLVFTKNLALVGLPVEVFVGAGKERKRKATGAVYSDAVSLYQLQRIFGASRDEASPEEVPKIIINGFMDADTGMRVEQMAPFDWSRMRNQTLKRIGGARVRLETAFINAFAQSREAWSMEQSVDYEPPEEPAEPGYEGVIVGPPPKRKPGRPKSRRKKGGEEGEDGGEGDGEGGGDGTDMSDIEDPTAV